MQYKKYIRQEKRYMGLKMEREYSASFCNIMIWYWIGWTYVISCLNFHIEIGQRSQYFGVVFGV